MPLSRNGGAKLRLIFETSKGLAEGKADAGAGRCSGKGFTLAHPDGSARVAGHPQVAAGAE